MTTQGPTNQDPLDDERTDSVPRVVPNYSDDEARELGERLAALYQAREADPNASVSEEIIRIRYKMRKGPRLQAGEFLQDGRYRLIERSHHGSVDGYWIAFDRVSGELVLVRVFHADWVTDPKSVRAFVHRGDALERLLHPGIGGVLDAARSDDGFVYLATKYFAEGDLASAKLDTIDAMQVGIEIAHALRYAHDHGVLHGDVRPQNVMLSKDGGAHLVGFSIEPRASADGTSLFRAPETTEHGYVLAAAADVYSIGMTTIAALHKADLPFWVLRDPGRLIRSLPTSESVKGVLGKAVDWDLGVRFPTIAAMLEDWLADVELVSALAVRARERQRHGVAAEHYETLLTLQPARSVEIRTILGEVYAAMGAHDRAFDHLLLALERTSDVESLFEPLRAAAEHTSAWSRLAEALWTQARARDAGRRVVLRMELARVNHEHLGNPVAAAETWTQVLADHRTPEQAVLALRNLCSLATLRQDWVGYTEYAQELIDYLPEAERPPLEYTIGRAYLEHLNEETRGLEFIDRAEASGYTEVGLATRMQGIRARRGQWKRVIQLMVQQAQSQDIGDASPTLLRAGIIASAVHLEEEAFTVYHALLERAPKHVVALRHVARLHHRAHEHEQALSYYDRLWDTYRGRESEEPEASERAADCTAYAALLLKANRADDAVERLSLALKLNPNHVPSLQLAGPLFLSRGDIGQAGAVFDRLLSLFKSVELSAQKIEACLGMGELAWIQGRLTAAMGWYNRAIELDPFNVHGWWGLAKVALASRGGHPGADRAPWVMAVPKRYTGFEALARLIAGLIDPAALRSWLALSPLGQAVLDAGETAMRSACACVDLLARNEMIDPQLFQRLSEAFPTWHAEVEVAQNLWLNGAASTFPVPRSYGWTRRLLEGDFDPSETRAVLPPELEANVVAAGALATSEAWQLLLGGRRPPFPEPFEAPLIEPVQKSTRYAGPIGALVRDGHLAVALRRDQLSAEIGSADGMALRIVDDPAIGRAHARLFRQGGRIYIASVDDGRVQVDGETRGMWRLIGGERITLGETRLQYQVFDDDSRLPPPMGAPDPKPRATARWLSSPPASSPAGAPEAPSRTNRSQSPSSAPSASAPAPAPTPAPASASTSSAAAAAASPTPGPTRATPSRPAAPTWAPVSTPVPAESAGAGKPAGKPSKADSDTVPLATAVPLEPEWPANSESARLLEPTAALRIDGLRELALGEGDDGEFTVPLAAVAEAPGGVPEISVQIPASTGSDVPDDGDSSGWRSDGPGAPENGASASVVVDQTDEMPDQRIVSGSGWANGRSAAQGSSLPALPDAPEAGDSDSDSASESDAGDINDDPSEEEVVQSPNGRIPAMVRVHGEPDEATRKVIRVMDDGSVDTGPIPEDVLREALGLPAPPPLANPPAAEPGWTAVTDGDDEDSDEAEPPRPAKPRPEDATTVRMENPRAAAARAENPASNATPSRVDPSDGVPTLIESARHAQTRDPSADGVPNAVFGFPQDLQDDNVERLSPEPAKVGRGVAPRSLPPTSQAGTQATGAPAGSPASLPPFRPAPGAPKPTPRTDAPSPSAAAGPAAAVASGGASAGNERPAALEIMSGPERGKKVPLAAEVRVGQSRQCEVSIPADGRLSAVHCRVSRTTDGFLLTDEGSANGTVVNGQRVTRFALRGGEVIMVGRTVLKFWLDGGAA